MSIERFLEARIDADELLAHEGSSLTVMDSRLAVTDEGRVSATG